MVPSRSFAPLGTIANAWSFFLLALNGQSVRDKWLAFLLCSLVSACRSRLKGRAWLLQRIDGLAQGDWVKLRWRHRAAAKAITFQMRRGNECDYLIGGELVKGAYAPPDFTPETIVDGGANIGMFTLVASACFPTARLTCYEPDPENLAALRKNLEANSVSAELCQKGLWGSERTLYFHSRGSYDGFINDQPSDSPITCLLPRIGPECWLKLDVEGAEYEVLPALFARKDYPRWISMEIHQFNTRGMPLLALMRQHGYSVAGGDDLTLDCTNISAERQTPPVR